ncbi:MAG: anthranilate phosphoribosyltransferase [Calditrichaeota bacterium]|nr:MAG: anthranilate phosphoribosyltransferase [Calditrichota bacterium]
MIKEAINKFLKGESLTRREAYLVMDEILSGSATEAQISAFLVALQLKGSTVDELAGSVDAYRERIIPLSVTDENAIDCSGTGGDDLGTFNISTAAAFVAAGAGAKVIKHGYHGVSSQCGSEDVLQALGIKTDLSPEQFYQVLDRAGLAFIFAPRYKPIPRNFAGIRQSIGARTLINILDPLTKPALTKRQLIGVYDYKLSRLIAEVLQQFGIFRIMVVSGDNGLDELNISGKTYVVEVEGDAIEEYELHPEDVGLRTWPVEDLKGGDAETNKQILLDILSGKDGAPRDVTILNAAAALKVAGVVNDLSEGVEKATEAIDRGRAREKLQEMVALSKEL